MDSMTRFRSDNLTEGQRARIAALVNKPLCKYEDPTEGERDDLTIEEAEDVAGDDLSLVYLEVEDSELQAVWDGLDTPIFCAVDQFGVNVAESRLRRLNSWSGPWLYVDSVDGWDVVSGSDGQLLAAGGRRLAKQQLIEIRRNWDGEPTLNDVVCEYFNRLNCSVDTDGDIWLDGGWADDEVEVFVDWLKTSGYVAKEAS